MKTINFTNRERIMIGDDINALIDYLDNKLPDSNYMSSCSEDEYYQNRKSAHPTITSICSTIEGQSERK